MSKANAILRGTISKPVSYTSFALFMVTIILALINAFLYEFNLVMYFIGLGCYTFGIVMMCAHVVYGYRNACASLRELAKDWKDCEFDFSNIGMFKSRRFIMVYRIGSVDNV
ncbi:hypothetical protein BC833DRAFT_599633 [Globomyces pollinis-pini]|nr:hypothetical protein BC833DRAFT_599633 [Globomyces pollinis-pini]